MTKSLRRSTRRTARAYDEAAEKYRDWWGPIIAPGALPILDHVAASMERDPATLLDIGTGSGLLATAALQRWPHARVIGVDPSRRILELAHQRAEDAGVADRLELRHGDALALPLDNDSVDAAVSSFVIQLTASRSRFLREAARAVRPGGRVGIVNWQDVHDGVFEPADALEDAFDEVNAPEPRDGHEVRAWLGPSVARRELAAAGLRHTGAEVRWIEHRFTPESYLGLAEHWIADDIFEAMTEPERLRLREAAIRRLRPLSPETLTWRRPTVLAWGRRPSADEPT
ncbi:MAG: methyltransferase domain-containing protein [Chloroflexota bacterium]